METTFATATLWIGFGLVATLAAWRLRISSALTEIVVGIAAAAIAARVAGPDALGSRLPWLTFLASTGSVVLTFLAGAELDPAALRAKWKEVWLVGLVGFLAPFLGCAAVARFLLGWSGPASWLAGVALSTTSMRWSTRSCSSWASIGPSSARGSWAPASSTISGPWSPSASSSRRSRCAPSCSWPWRLRRSPPCRS